MPSYRLKRVEELLRDEIVNIIRRDMDGGQSPFMTITAVKVSKDLSTAKVYVSFLEGQDAESWLAKLDKAGGYIRSELSRVIRLRRIPRLYFKRDETIAKAFKLEEVFERINKENERNSEENNGQD
jgi:ribosome-binding factor A